MDANTYEESDILSTPDSRYAMLEKEIRETFPDDEHPNKV